MWGAGGAGIIGGTGNAPFGSGFGAGGGGGVNGNGGPGTAGLVMVEF
jgi:hypothetical protein